MLLFILILSLASCLAIPVSNRNSRIFGGEPARAGEFPFATAIDIRKTDGNYFCGGALVHRQWVITSGHCVNNYVSFTIHLGTLHRTGDANEKRVTSTFSIQHSDWDPEGFDADIGLILFHMPIVLNDYIQLIRLPDIDVSTQYVGVIVGWGETDPDSSAFSEVLNFVQVLALENAECQNIFPPGTLTENLVCAVGNNNEGLCTGDTGGPLVQYINGYPFVNGIGSFMVEGCGGPYPSGFTRTFKYVPWIRNTIGV